MAMTSRFPRVALGVSVALVLGCGGDTAPPGDEVIGRFRFTAELVDRGACPFSEIPEGGRFEFEGIFSRRSSGEGAWFTVSGANQDGAWDGQRFTSEHDAPRRFEAGLCDDNRFVVTERLRVAILSASQDAALGAACPQDGQALLQDGAVPVDEDAGIKAPGPQDTGYDAVRACGVLEHRITPQEGACGSFTGCTLLWRVTGGRRQ